MFIGYARVSTTDQNLALQIETLESEGCTKLFTEKASGANSERIELKSVLEFIREDDVLVVTKLDRLARSMVDFWNIVKKIEGRGASLKVLNMGLDTRSSQGRLVMGVLSSVAEFERSIIRERQQDGIEKAKRDGKKLGRPSKKEALTDDVLALLDSGKTKQAVADKLGIGVATVYRIVKASKEASTSPK